MADDRKKFAEAAAARLGVNPDIIYAHTVLEVGREGKTVGQFNYGNIKAGSRWAGPTATVDALEYDKAGNPVKERSKFRAYSDPEQAGADYAALLMSRYPGAAGAKDAASFATALQLGGYATDPKYVQKFVQVAGGVLPADRQTGTGTGAYVPRTPMPRLPDPLQEVMPGKARYATPRGAGDAGIVPAQQLTIQGAPRADVIGDIEAEAAEARKLMRPRTLACSKYPEQVRSPRASWVRSSGVRLRGPLGRMTPRTASSGWTPSYSGARLRTSKSGWRTPRIRRWRTSGHGRYSGSERMLKRPAPAVQVSLSSAELLRRYLSPYYSVTGRPVWRLWRIGQPSVRHLPRTWGVP